VDPMGYYLAVTGIAKAPRVRHTVFVGPQARLAQPSETVRTLGGPTSR